MFKSHIKLMVLRHLSKEALSGYDLMNYLGEYENRPSPGYIYPLLKDLQKKGFILVKKEERRKIYSISPKGTKLLENLKNKHEEMMNTMAGIGDKKEIKEFIRLRAHMKRDYLFSQDKETLIKLNKTIFSFYTDKRKERERR